MLPEHVTAIAPQRPLLSARLEPRHKHQYQRFICCVTLSALSKENQHQLFCLDEDLWNLFSDRESFTQPCCTDSGYYEMLFHSANSPFLKDDWEHSEDVDRCIWEKQDERI
jgi:hypothetical protein